MNKILAAGIPLLIFFFITVSTGQNKKLEGGKAVKASADRCDHARSYDTYSSIHNLYVKWDNGFFGSRRYYEKELYRKLLDETGKCITTGSDYLYQYDRRECSSPVSCRFYYCEWLYITGDIDKESIRAIINNDPMLLRRWWRSTEMVSLSGKIKKFYLLKNRPRRVLLVLDSITVKRRNAPKSER